MAQEDFKRKLTAVLSADAVGYSRLMEDNEEATIRTLNAYRASMSALIKQHRGRVVDTTGDNLLSEFTSAVDAVNCAVEIQRDLAERNAELPYERKMEFRIGANVGDVVEEDDRIYGDGVNIAARVEGLAEAGGICISGRAYDQVANKLGLEYENLGEHQVKNISQPIRVYRVLSLPGAAAHRVIKAKKAVGRTWRSIVVAIGAVLILGAGAAAIWNFYLRSAPPPAEVVSEQTPAPESPQKKPPAVSEKPSIAVLPFANISGDPKEDYLSDGVTEQIITALSKTPRMLVIARNSVFTYKGKPVMVQQVSEELGVRYVLEGSVQRSGDRLRITAQLIDAKTGNHLWSDRYDRDLKDLFDLQDDITRNVIMALQVKLTAGESARFYNKGTANLEAYLKAMKGIPHIRLYSKDDQEIARRLFGEAIALDPNYANAYVLLAWTYFIEANLGWSKTPAKSYAKAIELAKQVISRDELSATAYMLLASVYAKTGQFEKAMTARKKGLSLDPTNSYVNYGYGFALYNAGKFKEAITFIKKAIRTDPKPPGMYLLHLGFAYLFTGQHEEAIAVSKNWVRRKPSDADAHLTLGYALIGEGKPEEAVAMLEKGLSLGTDSQGWYVGNLAVARLGAGQPEEAITTLREVLSRDPENAEVCRLLSLLLTCEGRHAEALSMAKKAISLKPAGWGTFYDNFGLSHLMMGQYEEAIAAYKKAINIWPDFVSGHLGLTASYSLAGRMEEARAEAAEVLRINPKITLKDITKNGYYNFKKADKERFINALHKAGLK